MKHFDIAPAEGFHPELGLLISTWRDGWREWTDNLGEVADEHVFWQPYENGPSIGGVILHMVACDQWWILGMAGEMPDPEKLEIAFDLKIDQYVPHWPTPPAEPMAWYSGLLKETREAMFERIRVLADPMLMGESPGKWDYTLRWVVAHLIEHDSYHGGQCVLLHEMAKRTPYLTSS